MMEASETSGNAEEDWKVYQMLCKEIEMDTSDVDVTTSLRSEVAALQFKRDRLAEELNDMKCQMRTRDQRCLDLQAEADQLREQSARQNAIISSLKKRICEMEERERNLYAAQGRTEISVQSIQRDCRYHEDRAKELEKKLRVVELDLNSEEQKKDNARMTLQDLIRRLSVTLGCEVCDGSSSEILIHKANELMQELSRLRSRSCTTNDALAAAEIELRSCKDNFERALGEKECLERQSAGHLLEIDRLRESKETLEMQLRVLERELSEMKEKLASSTRSLGSASGNIAQQESIICQLKDELKQKEEKCQRLQHENRHVLESLSILLSSPARFVESLENSIKDRIREIQTENKDKAAQIETLREKLAQESQTLTRQLTLSDQANNRIRILEEERNLYETRLNKAETEISTCELSREGLKRDKNTFMSFLERLGRILNMEEISNDVGVDLHTESLLLRAEQLSRLESDKLVDKLLCCGYGTLPRLCRQRSFHDLRDTSLVYQLQRRVRTLREQVQRKDLHLDLLRRKLSLQEDNTKTKCLMQSERDEANLRIKKLVKQVDRLQLQLSDTKSQVRDLNAQLAEAADYKITALERGRKIEELQKRLIESETLRTKYNRKVTLLKDQVRTTGETIEQERNISDHSLHLLRDELGRIKDNLCEVNRREVQLQNFKGSVAKILGAALPIPDYELITRLQKLVDAHHDYTLVSRRYDDPVLRLTARSPTGGSRCTRTPDRSRYDDSGYTDAADIIDDIDDDLFKTRQTRPCI